MSGAREEFEASVEAAEGEVKRLEGAGLEACDVTVAVVLCRVLVKSLRHQWRQQRAR